MAAARYVAMNPVRARLVERAEDPAVVERAAHLAGRDDGLVKVAPLLSRCGRRFADLIEAEPAPALTAALRAAETIGRPVEAPPFLDRSPRWPGVIHGRESGAASRGPWGPIRKTRRYQEARRLKSSIMHVSPLPHRCPRGGVPRGC